MSTIVTRAGKGSPLTHTEVDNNFTNLNTDKYQSGDSASFSSITNTGNLTFTGTGNRITGDFSNATLANRVYFQTSTTNSNTTVPALPNGTANQSQFLAYNGTDPANSGFAQMLCNTAEMSLRMGIAGTGSYLPLTMYTGGSERLRIDTSGNVGIGTSSPASNSLSIARGAGVGCSVEIAANGATPASTNCFTLSQGGSNDAYVFNRANQPLIFGTNNTERMRIDSSGNVIQTTGSYFLGNGGGFGWGDLSTYVGGTSASDFINFITNSSERMRIDSSGNVGIGTSSPQTKLQLDYTGSNAAAATGLGAFQINQAGVTGLNGTAGIEFKCSVFGSGYGAKLSAFDDGSLVIGNRANSATWSERMRIDSSGNVGIGTSSPATILDARGTVRSTNGTNYVDMVGSDGSIEITRADGVPFIDFKSSTAEDYDCRIQQVSDGLTFQTGGNGSAAERMRIASDGNVSLPVSTGDRFLRIGNGRTGNGYTFIDLQGDTTYDNGLRLIRLNTGANAGSSIESRGTGAFQFVTQEAAPIVFFTNGGNERMRITSGGEVYIAGTTDQGAYNLQCNGTGVWGAGAYVNGSDERIKNDIEPLDSGLDVVAKLNPVTYKYKEDWSKDQSTQTGFIAQELLTALEGKNYIDGVVQQGGEYMSVAYQNIIPILTKAIQEQQAIINELKTRIETLENK